MKKTMIILSALLALVACNKEMPQNEGVIDPSKVVFNINVQTADDAATKGVKTGWVNGDVVYVFFEDNTTQYVKMTYNGSAWSYSDKDGGNSYTGLTLTDSGKKLSAVYMPSFVIGEATPSYTDKWTIGTTLGGYILKAETVAYSVYSRAGNITTLEATLSMTAPANMVQVYFNESDPSDGNEYVLNMTNVKPFTFNGIAPGGAATITAGTVNFPLPAYNGTLGTDPAGYYFWGILDNASAGAINYNFQLVEQDADKKYAISSKSKTVNANITGPKAIKLTSLTSNGKFVSLGYSGGPLWATGNLKEDDDYLADPLEYGNYYKWCYITPYDVTGESDAYSSYASSYNKETTDAAYQKNTNWYVPSSTIIQDLKNNCTATWDDESKCKILTSNANGISLFFKASGYYDNGILYYQDSKGYYWSNSSIMGPPIAYRLIISEIEYNNNADSKYRGMSVRPVKN